MENSKIYYTPTFPEIFFSGLPLMRVGICNYLKGDLDFPMTVRQNANPSWAGYLIKSPTINMQLTKEPSYAEHLPRKFMYPNEQIKYCSVPAQLGYSNVYNPVIYSQKLGCKCQT